MSAVTTDTAVSSTASAAPAPYLRRADVELDRPRLTEPTTVPRQETTGAPALRPEQRTPVGGGQC